MTCLPRPINYTLAPQSGINCILEIFKGFLPYLTETQKCRVAVKLEVDWNCDSECFSLSFFLSFFFSLSLSISLLRCLHFHWMRMIFSCKYSTFSLASRRRGTPMPWWMLASSITCDIFTISQATNVTCYNGCIICYWRYLKTTHCIIINHTSHCSMYTWFIFPTIFYPLNCNTVVKIHGKYESISHSCNSAQKLSNLIPFQFIHYAIAAQFPFWIHCKNNSSMRRHHTVEIQLDRPKLKVLL